MPIDPLHQKPISLESSQMLDPSVQTPSAPLQQEQSSTFTPSKPVLYEDLALNAPAQALIFAGMFDRMQNYVMSTAEPAELKQDYMIHKITKHKQELRKAERALLDTKSTVSTWDGRKKIANYLFNGVSILTGMGLIASGQTVAGGSMIASGAGSIGSLILEHHGCNSKLTSALSIASAVIGLGGSIGALTYNLYKKPAELVQALNSEALHSFFQKAGSLTSFFSSSASLYASSKRNEGMKKTSEIEALHTKVDTALKSLEQKLSGAFTSFQGKAKDFSQIIKTIARAQRSYTDRAMRVFTADFRA